MSPQAIYHARRCVILALRHSLPHASCILAVSVHALSLHYSLYKRNKSMSTTTRSSIMPRHGLIQASRTCHDRTSEHNPVCNACVSLVLNSTRRLTLRQLVQGANVDLRDRLHETSAQAEACRAQVEALQGLQSNLQQSAGPSVDALIEAAVARERALQDARNKKVLELLNNKVCCCHCSC